MKKIFTLFLAVIVMSTIFTAQINSVTVNPENPATGHTVAVELIRKSPLFDNNGVLVAQSIGNYYPVGASELEISYKEIDSKDITLHAGIYVYNDPGTATLTLALYPSNPAITLKAQQDVIVNGYTVMENGEPLFGNAYTIPGRYPDPQYEGCYGSILDPIILNDGVSISNQKDMKIFWADGGANNRVAQNVYNPNLSLNDAKDLYFATFDIIIPKNLPAGDYFIYFDKNFCRQSSWNSSTQSIVGGNPSYVPLKITVNGFPAKGDVNLDGEINSLDVVRMIQALSGKKEYAFSAAERSQADCCYEARVGEQYPSDIYPSIVNVQDLLAVIQYSMGMIDNLPVYSG